MTTSTDRRLRLTWTDNESWEEVPDLNEYGAIIGTRMEPYAAHWVAIQEWTSDDDEWETIDDIYSSLRRGDDSEDEAPYTRCENEVLAAAGLTRDDLTDPTSTPW